MVMLSNHLSSHSELVQYWAENISWMWPRCQPPSGHQFYSKWITLMGRLQRTQPSANIANLDTRVEDLILGEQLNDGEEVDDLLVLDMENLDNVEHDGEDDGTDAFSDIGTTL